MSLKAVLLPLSTVFCLDRWFDKLDRMDDATDGHSGIFPLKRIENGNSSGSGPAFGFGFEFEP